MLYNCCSYHLVPEYERHYECFCCFLFDEKHDDDDKNINDTGCSNHDEINNDNDTDADNDNFDENDYLKLTKGVLICVTGKFFERKKKNLLYKICLVAVLELPVC